MVTDAVSASPPIPLRSVGVLHLCVSLRQRLGSDLVLEREPRGLEARLGVVNALGIAERRTGGSSR
jgi:hypothetical protein